MGDAMPLFWRFVVTSCSRLTVAHRRRGRQKLGEALSKISALRFFLRILVGIVPESGIKVDSGRLCPVFDHSFSNAGFFVGSYLARVEARMAGVFVHVLM